MEMLVKVKAPQHLLINDHCEVVVNVLGTGRMIEELPSFVPKSFTFHPTQYTMVIDHDGLYNYVLGACLDAYKQQVINNTIEAMNNAKRAIA